jgi:hypothetical protein
MSWGQRRMSKPQLMAQQQSQQRVLIVAAKRANCGNNGNKECW